MEPEKRISEIATLVLGGLGIVLLINALAIMIDDPSCYGALAGFFILFYQGIVALVALPFLVKSFRRERINAPYYGVFVVFSSINNS